MFSVNHAAGSTSIPQGFQDPQYPVPGFFPAYYPWQSYPLLETSRPPLATVPNAILPPASSFNPSTDGFSTGPSSAMANYQGQNAVYPPQNMIAPTFHIQNACFQRTIYPFADMYLGNMVSAPLVAGDGGQAQAAAAAPAPFQWPLPMQGGAETHASQGQADQQDLVDTVYAQGYPSLPQQDQTSVGYEVQPLNQAGPSNDLGSSALRQKSALRPQKKLAKKGNELYRCSQCGKCYPEYMRTQHDRTHEPEKEKFPCKICEILENFCQPLSRKDALKRHIEKKHPEFKGLLHDLSLNILKPNLIMDLWPLRQAMSFLQLQNEQADA